MGDTEINHYKFLSNSVYTGHGTAIYYSSNYSDPQLPFKINNCNFTNNVDAISIIYAEQLKIQVNGIFILLNHSHFYDNQGISFFLSNHNLQITGNSTFTNNTAENGAAIFAANNSIITFSSHSTVIFNHNTAKNSGGAIYLTNYSLALFEGTSEVTFNRNSAPKRRWRIYLFL